MKIELADLPEVLRERVSKDLTSFKDSVLLGCEVHESTPFTVKSRKSTRYTAYLEWGNLFKVYSVSFSGSVFDGQIQENSMIAGEIDFFLQHSNWLKVLAERAIETQKKTG